MCWVEAFQQNSRCRVLYCDGMLGGRMPNTVIPSSREHSSTSTILPSCQLQIVLAQSQSREYSKVQQHSGLTGRMGYGSITGGLPMTRLADLKEVQYSTGQGRPGSSALSHQKARSYGSGSTQSNRTTPPTCCYLVSPSSSSTRFPRVSP